MNRKKLITYDDKTGEILHEKEVYSWSGMDLISITDLSVEDATDVIVSLQWKQRRINETIEQLQGAVRRSEVLSTEDKKMVLNTLGVTNEDDN